MLVTASNDHVNRFLYSGALRHGVKSRQNEMNDVAAR